MIRTNRRFVYHKMTMVRIIRKRRATLWISSGVVVVLIASYGLWALYRPLPRLTPEQATKTTTIQTPASSLAWPASQSAIGIVGQSVLETHGAQTPVPTASTAKMITVLTVLKKKPLQAGQQGPMITLSDSDVAIYAAYKAADGSAVQVEAGEQISEYQMLQAILLPSANNIADSLAIWAYGSLDAYATAANTYMKSLNLHNTTVGKDASGLDPSTTSTAEDLVRIGMLMMQNPVLAQIVGQQTATNIPVAGTIKNVNFLLGKNNIIGIKTGNSDQAGGAFVSAAQVKVDGKQLTLVTARVAAPNLFDAVQGSLPFIVSAESNFKSINIVKAGDSIGRYNLPWGGTVEAVAASSLQRSVWAGSSQASTVTLESISSSSSAGDSVGKLTSGTESVGIKLKGSIPQPTVRWRLLHPLN